MRVTDHLYWQGRAAWGRSLNVSPFLTFADKFDSERWLVSTSLAYMHDTAQRYRDTFGLAIPFVRSTTGLAEGRSRVQLHLPASDGLAGRAAARRAGGTLLVTRLWPASQDKRTGVIALGVRGQPSPRDGQKRGERDVASL